jgi:hypothetical protein
MRRRKTATRAVTRRHAAGHQVEAPYPSPAGRGSSLRKTEYSGVLLRVASHAIGLLGLATTCLSLRAYAGDVNFPVN